MLLGMLVLASACGPSEPLRMTTLQLGRSLNSDNSVAEHTTAFRREDTMFVSVLTGAPGSSTIGVRWTYGGRLVSEESREVSYRDQSATEFHIQNSGGFPPGSYAVEVLIDGEVVGQRNFRVVE